MRIPYFIACLKTFKGTHLQCSGRPKPPRQMEVFYKSTYPEGGRDDNTKSISFLGHTQASKRLHFCVHFTVHFKLLITCQVLADGYADGRVHYLCTLRQYFGHPLPGNKVSPLHSLLPSSPNTIKRCKKSLFYSLLCVLCSSNILLLLW